MPELSFSDIRMGIKFSFPQGDLSVSTSPYLGYEPLLISFEPIIEQLYGGVDDITVTLENSTTVSNYCHRRLS